MQWLEIAVVAAVAATFTLGLAWAVRGRSAISSNNTGEGSNAVTGAGDATSIPFPVGWTGLMPYLTVNDSRAALAFYEKAFGAVELPGRLTAPDGTVMNAVFQVADTRVMIADEFLGDSPMRSASPLTLGDTPVKLNLYVDDCDAVMAAAVAAGAREIAAPEDQFFGARVGRIEDPFGHVWMISTQTQAMDDTELNKRFNQLFS